MFSRKNYIIEKYTSILVSISAETIIIIAITVLSFDDKRIEAEMSITCYENSLYEQFYVMLYEFILNLSLPTYKYWLSVTLGKINTSKWFIKNQNTSVLPDYIKTSNWKKSKVFKTNSVRVN